jgi:hypothetical protein
MVKRRAVDDHTGPKIRQMAQELERRIATARSLAKEHGFKLKKVSNALADRSWILSGPSGNILNYRGSIDSVERFLKDYKSRQR